MPDESQAVPEGDRRESNKKIASPGYTRRSVSLGALGIVSVPDLLKKVGRDVSNTQNGFLGTGTPEVVLAGGVSQRPDLVTRGWDAVKAEVSATNLDDVSRQVMFGYSLGLPDGSRITSSSWWPTLELQPGQAAEATYTWLPGIGMPTGTYVGTVTVATCTTDSLSGSPDRDKQAFTQLQVTENIQVLSQPFSRHLPEVNENAVSTGETSEAGLGAPVSGGMLDAAANYLGPTAHGFFEGFTQAIESFIEDMAQFLDNPIQYIQSMVDGMIKLLNNLKRLARNLIDGLIQQFNEQMNEANPYNSGTGEHDSFNYGYVGGFAVFKLAKFYFTGGVSQLRQVFTKLKKFRSFIGDLTASSGVAAAALKLSNVVSRQVARELSNLSFVADDVESLEDLRESLPDSTVECLDELVAGMESHSFVHWLHGGTIEREHLGFVPYFKRVDDDYRLVRDLLDADLEEGEYVRLANVEIKVDSPHIEDREIDTLVARVDSTDTSPPEVTVHKVGEVTIGKKGPETKAEQLERALDRAMEEENEIEAAGISASSFPDDRQKIVRRVAGPSDQGYGRGDYIGQAKAIDLGYNQDDFQRVWKMHEQSDGKLLQPVTDE